MREFFIYALQNLLVLDALILILWLLVCIRMLFPVEFHLGDLNQSWKGWQVQLKVETDDASRTDREAEEEIFLNGESTYAQMSSADIASVQSASEGDKEQAAVSEKNHISEEAKAEKQEAFSGFLGDEKAGIPGCGVCL